MRSFIPKFIDNYTSKHTKEAYKRDLHSFFDFIKDNPKIEREDLLKYRDTLLEYRLAPTTINRKFSGLSSFYDWLVAQGEADTNPIKGVKLPRASVTNPTQAFTDEEAQTVIKLAETDEHKLILLLLFNCGIRRSELLNITKSDVTEMEEHLVLRVFGKGGKIREIPINESVKDLLLKFVQTSEEKLFKYNASTIYRLIRHYCKKAGITKRLSPHSCRATAITKALEQNVPITDVADFAGHGDITTTQVYWKRRRGLKESPAYKLNYK